MNLQSGVNERFQYKLICCINVNYYHLKKYMRTTLI